MVMNVERKRKRKTSTSTRPLVKKSAGSHEWTVPSLTLGRNDFHFGGSNGNRPQCFLATFGRNQIASNQTEDVFLVFSCHWYDQGWGDRQGRILIVEQERPLFSLNTVALSIPMASGRLVAMSPLVEHSERGITMSFRAKPDKVYQFWVVVGGGGYNQLYLKDVTLRNHTQSQRNTSLEATMLELGLNTDNRPSFVLAPLDVKRKIVSFLSPVDVIHLISTSKSLATELGISQMATPLLNNKENNPKAYCTNASHPSCFAIYIPTRANQLHSVLFQCTISMPDYGSWCLGPVTVSIVAQRMTQDANKISQLPFEIGRLVSKRSIVFGNCKTPISLTFHPRDGECYQVWLSRDGSFVPPTTLGFGGCCGESAVSDHWILCNEQRRILLGHLYWLSTTDS